MRVDNDHVGQGVIDLHEFEGPCRRQSSRGRKGNPFGGLWPHAPTRHQSGIKCANSLDDAVPRRHRKVRASTTAHDFTVRFFHRRFWPNEITLFNGLIDEPFAHGTEPAT